MRRFLIVTGLAIALGTRPSEPMPPSIQNGFGGNSPGVPIASSGLIAVVPESRDSLAAWSHTTGVWSRIPIKPKKDEAIVPIVGTGVAAARIGNMVYGYGSEAGKWRGR